MKISLDHLPENKQRNVARIVDIIHEEFDDALKEAKSEAKRRGRILKIILFGSYAKGTWVDEPHTMKGYRSDFDVLVIVNESRFAGFEYSRPIGSMRVVRAKRCDGETGQAGNRDNPSNVGGIIACKADWDLVRRPHQGQQSPMTASTGRTEDCTRPTRQNVELPLAMRGPSTEDISETRLIDF